VVSGHVDVNNRGQVVGQTMDASGQLVGFLRDPGGRITIIKLPGGAAVGEILALNDRGQIVIPELGTGLSPLSQTSR
jgi:hypothetical protein